MLETALQKYPSIQHVLLKLSPLMCKGIFILFYFLLRSLPLSVLDFQMTDVTQLYFNSSFFFSFMNYTFLFVYIYTVCFCILICGFSCEAFYSSVVWLFLTQLDQRSRFGLFFFILAHCHHINYFLLPK